MAKKKKPDYYAILGITVKANDKQIKNAAIKKLHFYSPENYGGGDADAKAEMIIEARDTLLDFDKRKKYDQYWLETYNDQPTANEQLEDNDSNAVVNSDGTVSKHVTKRVHFTKNTKSIFKFFEKFQLPEREVNKKYPFLFNVFNWKVDGMVFIITGVIIPLISLLLLSLVGNMGHVDANNVTTSKITMEGQDAAPMVFFGINIVSNIVGYIIFWQRDSKVFLKSGAVIFYSFIFVTGIVGILSSIILGLAIPVKPGQLLSDSPAYNIAIIWFQIFAEVIVIVLALIRTKDLRQRIWMTIKQNWIMLILVSAIVGAVLFGVVTGFSAIKPFSKNSANEDTLESGLKNGHMGYRVGYAISLAILTIFIAPFTEELATRQGIFAGVSNRTLALFVAAIYFGMLHVEGGDVEHMLTYVIGGLFLSSVFSASRGNVTYDTGVHMFYNTISFIIILARDFQPLIAK